MACLRILLLGALTLASCGAPRLSATPRVMNPGEGKALDVLGESITIKVDPAETQGAYAVIEERAPAGGGPPPHVHDHEDEIFYVLEGEVEFRVGDRVIPGPAGATGVLPRGIVHTFRNTGSTPCRVLVFISPGGFTKFFEEIDARGKVGTLTKEEAVRIARRYGCTILPPPGR